MTFFLHKVIIVKKGSDLKISSLVWRTLFYAFFAVGVKMQSFFSAKRLAKLGIFTALATVLYFLGFPLPMLFPSFLKLNLSDLPALICSFSLGPLSGFIVVLIKCVIHLLASSSYGAGELADLLIGGAFVVVAGLVYKYKKTKKVALLGILLGTAASVSAAIIANRFIIIPVYTLVMGLPFSEIVNMCSAVLPFINEANFYPCYLFLAVLPFNLLRCALASCLTWLVYKRVSNLLEKL